MFLSQHVFRVDFSSTYIIPFLIEMIYSVKEHRFIFIGRIINPLPLLQWMKSCVEAGYFSSWVSTQPSNHRPLWGPAYQVLDRIFVTELRSGLWQHEPDHHLGVRRPFYCFFGVKCVKINSIAAKPGSVTNYPQTVRSAWGQVIAANNNQGRGAQIMPGLYQMCFV